MPIYEFHCEHCEHDSEILVRSSDWAGTECPLCGSKKLAKRFSTFASATAGATKTAAPPPPTCMARGGGCGCGRGGPHRH